MPSRNPRRSRRRAPGLLELRAYHEAGHAVAAHLRGFALRRVSVARRGRYGGSCEYEFDLGPLRDRARRRARRQDRGERGPSALRRAARAAAAVALSGSVAQDELTLSRGYLALDPATGRPFPLFAAGSGEDEKVARWFADRLYRGRGARRSFLQRMRTSTQRLLTRAGPWAAVSALARRLLSRRTIGGPEAEAIIRRTLGTR
jgi:hypothetical protein